MTNSAGNIDFIKTLMYNIFVNTDKEMFTKTYGYMPIHNLS